MITLPEQSSEPVVELVEYLNQFVPALFAADKLRNEERVTAFVELATKFECFTQKEAIEFAMKPI